MAGITVPKNDESWNVFWWGPLPCWRTQNIQKSTSLQRRGPWPWKKCQMRCSRTHTCILWMFSVLPVLQFFLRIWEKVIILYSKFFKNSYNIVGSNKIEFLSIWCRRRVFVDRTTNFSGFPCLSSRNNPKCLKMMTFFLIFVFEKSNHFSKARQKKSSWCEAGRRKLRYKWTRSAISSHISPPTPFCMRSPLFSL